MDGCFLKQTLDYSFSQMLVCMTLVLWIQLWINSHLRTLVILTAGSRTWDGTKLDGVCAVRKSNASVPLLCPFNVISFHHMGT